ncbi:toxin-antitoxin system YwqK family antitoxin [Flavobacterium artemisiae]|uniref:Toxin-antitoxin system YwqK family antitoxin n=1 Tax=Flavobacterium artemisiae TaxID=2126556 RepID=A0ABW4HL65_9FLAO
MKYKLILFFILFAGSIQTFAQMKNYSVFDKDDFDKKGIPKSLNGQVIYQGYVKGIGYVVNQIGEYKNGKKHGHFIFFIDGHLSCEEHYINGMLNGYSSCGESSGVYKNGKKDGPWKSSSDTGNSEIITYKKGKKDGYYERIFNMIKTVGRYSDDKKDGKWITYDEKGQVLTEIFFKKDIEVKI